jgi:hypothetical protein
MVNILVKHWMPQNWSRDAIVQELKEMGFTDIGLNPPALNQKRFKAGFLKQPNNPKFLKVIDWHRDLKDGHIFKGKLAFWSNMNPTQFRLIGSEEIVTPEPFAIVEVDNELYEHRMNPLPPNDRYFTRMRRNDET